MGRPPRTADDDTKPSLKLLRQAERTLTARLSTETDPKVVDMLIKETNRLVASLAALGVKPRLRATPERSEEPEEPDDEIQESAAGDPAPSPDEPPLAFKDWKTPAERGKKNTGDGGGDAQGPAPVQDE